MKTEAKAFPLKKVVFIVASAAAAMLLAAGLALAAGTLFFYPLSRERMLEIKDALEKRKTEMKESECD